MHDLRKKVLSQSRKTQSRKARAKEETGASPRSLTPSESKKSPGSSPRGSPISSKVGSRAGSRANSRPGSRYASEDEDELAEFYDTDEEKPLDVPFTEDDNWEDLPWATQLRTCIEWLQDLRKMSAPDRESLLHNYLYLIRHYYVHDQIANSQTAVLSSLISAIDRAASEQELLAAINALSVTLIQCPSDKAYDLTSKTLRKVCDESSSKKVKVAAINALAIAMVFEDGTEPEMEEVLEFLLEIVESDGHSVGAEDSGVVVTAALRAWGFVASYLDNLAEATEDGRAMEAYIDQLDSTDAVVQISAGYNIAQLFEAARENAKGSQKNAGLQHNRHVVLKRMRDIIKFWTKTTSRKDRRLHKDEFPSIIISIERGVGPGYVDDGRIVLQENGKYALPPSAEDPEGDSDVDPADDPYLGLHRKERAFSENRVIDDWKVHARLEVLKQVLGAGMDIHWGANPAVQAALRRSGRVKPEGEEDSDWDDGEE